MFEYDVDSDEEWEDPGEGEELGGSDNEEEGEGEQGEEDEEDDGFCVADGYLSDDECNGTGSTKRKLCDGQGINRSGKKARLRDQKVVVGPVCDWTGFETSIAAGEVNEHFKPLLAFRVECFMTSNGGFPIQVLPQRRLFDPPVGTPKTQTVVQVPRKVVPHPVVHHPIASGDVHHPAAVRPSSSPQVHLPAVKRAKTQSADKPQTTPVQPSPPLAQKAVHALVASTPHTVQHQMVSGQERQNQTPSMAAPKQAVPSPPHPSPKTMKKNVQHKPPAVSPPTRTDTTGKKGSILSFFSKAPPKSTKTH